MSEEKRRFMLPGDEIGTSEEYIAGEGTYEKSGMVYASNTGFLEIDTNEMLVRVVPATSTPVLLRVNDIILGDVYDNKGSMSIINVEKVSGEDRKISDGETKGSIHISKVQNGFLKDIRDAFLVGDIVRAKVIQVEPSLQLATFDSDLGVLMAYCVDCQLALKRVGKSLECPRCEALYRKKMAEDYGEAKL
jgi:exosome complex component CSL4